MLGMNSRTLLSNINHSPALGGEKSKDYEKGKEQHGGRSSFV